MKEQTKKKLKKIGKGILIATGIATGIAVVGTLIVKNEQQINEVKRIYSDGNNDFR